MQASWHHPLQLRAEGGRAGDGALACAHSACARACECGDDSFIHDRAASGAARALPRRGEVGCTRASARRACSCTPALSSSWPPCCGAPRRGARRRAALRRARQRRGLRTHRAGLCVAAAADGDTSGEDACVRALAGGGGGTCGWARSRPTHPLPRRCDAARRASTSTAGVEKQLLLLPPPRRRRLLHPLLLCAASNSRTGDARRCAPWRSNGNASTSVSCAATPIATHGSVAQADGLLLSRARWRAGDVSIFERSRLTGSPDPALMVKRATRGSGGGGDDGSQSDDAPPSLPDGGVPVVRTPRALAATMRHLVGLLDDDGDDGGGTLPRVGFEQIHEFVWDRTRAVRQDLSRLMAAAAATRAGGATASARAGVERLLQLQIVLHERIARFHVLAEHELLLDSSSSSSIGSHLNLEQLHKTLATLSTLYGTRRRRYAPSSPAAPSDGAALPTRSASLGRSL
eukprot:scaffold1333_cov274-Prasinococcus_capsulatus_cf.AAC.4